MKKQSKITGYFSLFEILLWIFSVILIILSFLIFDRSNYLKTFASLVGVTSLILAAKGNPLSQILMIIFSILYGIISFGFGYYGEMITYLGMTAPMSLISLISWLRNPYNGNKSQVRVNSLPLREIPVLLLVTTAVTVIFFFILQYFNTRSLFVSTLSVATSFAAVYLTFRRSPFYALAYAANDIVLIILWIMAAVGNTSYISVVICFTVFLINDLYGFFSWLRMKDNQQKK